MVLSQWRESELDLPLPDVNRTNSRGQTETTERAYVKSAVLGTTNDLCYVAIVIQGISYDEIVNA